MRKIDDNVKPKLKKKKTFSSDLVLCHAWEFFFFQGKFHGEYFSKGDVKYTIID